jgi:hypothetical protein
MFGLARHAIAGFAPGRNLPALALADCAAGLKALLPGSCARSSGWQ